MPEIEQPKLTVYGATWCPDCKRAKKFLSEQLIPYTWVDLGEHPEAQAIVEGYNDGKTIIPTLLFEDGTTLAEPSNARSPLSSAWPPPPSAHPTT